MKPQFMTRDLFWLVLLAACLCGWCVHSGGLTDGAFLYSPSVLGVLAVYSAPMWVPIVFVAYFVGRRDFDWLGMFSLMASEAVALFASAGLGHILAD